MGLLRLAPPKLVVQIQVAHYKAGLLGREVRIQPKCYILLLPLTWTWISHWPSTFLPSPAPYASVGQLTSWSPERGIRKLVIILASAFLTLKETQTFLMAHYAPVRGWIQGCTFRSLDVFIYLVILFFSYLCKHPNKCFSMSWPTKCCCSPLMHSADSVIIISCCIQQEAGTVWPKMLPNSDKELAVCAVPVRRLPVFCDNYTRAMFWVWVICFPLKWTGSISIYLRAGEKQWQTLGERHPESDWNVTQMTGCKLQKCKTWWLVRIACGRLWNTLASGLSNSAIIPMHADLNPCLLFSQCENLVGHHLDQVSSWKFQPRGKEVLLCPYVG